MAAAAAGGGDTIEELVVTAEKRSQSLQDVPVAISAFTSEKRDLLGINSIQDMTNFTPGLNYTSANDRTSLRGIGRLTNAHPVAVPVAVYDDGIYTTSTVTAGKTPIFSDRVEVLRGPQGTLYGRNSIGGAINVISKRPTEDPYAEVRATVANYGRTLLEAAVSGPLAPDLQYRIAGNWEKQRDGYYTNVVPGMPSEGNVIDQYYIEGQLQAKFGQAADGWAKAYVAGWNNGSGGPGARAGYSPAPYNFSEFGSQNVNAGFACAPGGVVANVVNASPTGCVNPASTDPRKFASLVAQTVSLDEAFGIAVNYTYHLPGMDLKYVGGGINYHYTLDSDNGTGSISSFQIPLRSAALGAPAPTCSPLYVAYGVCSALTINPLQSSTYQEDYHNISHEFTLASSGDNALQWIGGLYYYKEGYKQPVFTTLSQQTQLAGAFTPDGFATRSYNHTWTATTGTAGLQWDPEPGTMMYGRYSRGYLMGGINSGVTSVLGQFPFTNAEYDNDYEIGIKKDMFNKTLQINLALFWEDLSGYQAPLTVVAQTGALAVSQSQYLNIPKAVSRGAELEATWIPIDHLSVLFNYSLTDSYISTLTGIIDPADPEAMAAGAKPLTALQTCTGTNPAVAGGNALCDVNTGLVQRPQNLQGNSLPQSPKNKIALSVTYTWDMEKGSLSPSASYVWRDKQYAGVFERSYNASPSWSQTDLRMTWKDKENKYSIAAYVKNVFDTLGYDGGATGTRISGVYSASTIAAAGMTAGLPGVIPGTFNAVQKTPTFDGISTAYALTPPRTFGVEFQFRF